MTFGQLAARSSPRPATDIGARHALQRVPRIDSPFARDVLAGLSKPLKSVPCTWLYDRRGSELFERITGSTSTTRRAPRSRSSNAA